MNSEQFRAFVSYSHDSASHEQRVLRLANRLCTNGVDCAFDQYVTSPPEGWPKWMERELEAATHVLVVCTEGYNRKVRGGPLASGKGVRWESLLSHQLLYDAGAENHKFIPVLFSPDDVDHIPTSLKSFTWYVVHDDAGFWKLYRRITGQPEVVKPALGRLVTLPPLVAPDDDLAPPPTGSAWTADAFAGARRLIALVVDVPLASFTPARKSALLAAVRQLLEVDDVRVLRVDEGSTIVTLSLPGDAADRLYGAVRRGELAPLGVVRASLKESPLATGPDPAPAELEIPHRPRFWDVDLRLEDTPLMFRRYSVTVSESSSATSESARMELDFYGVMELVRQLNAGGAPPGTAAEVGKQLARALFTREVRQVWARGQAIKYPDTMLRLRLDIRSRELVVLPWELLRLEGERLLEESAHHKAWHGVYASELGTQDDYFLGMSPWHPIIRWQEGEGAAVAAAPLSPPVRLLVAVEGSGEARQRERMRALLQEPIADGRLTVDALTVRSLLDLRRNRRLHRFHVVHYVGDGFAADGVPDPELLRRMFGGGAQAQLLVLTAAPGSAAPPEMALGTAQAVFAAGLAAVVTSQGAMAAGADAFVRAFYTALAAGAALESCMAAARLAILRATDDRAAEWAAPVLFSRVRDGVIWDLPAPAPRGPAAGAAPAAPVSIPNNLPDREGPPLVGRDAELRRVLSLLSAGNPTVHVQLVGEAGAGRSALAYHAARECLRISRQAPAGRDAFRAVIRVSARHASPAVHGERGPERSPWSMDDLYATVAATLGKQGMSGVRPEERMAVLQEVLRRGRYLLVLDDVDLVADRRRDELLSALGPPNKVLLVCGTRLEGVEEEVAVAPLDAAHAVELLRADARATGVLAAVDEATPDELTQLVEGAGRLPFVLRWAVAYLRDSRARVRDVAAVLLAREPDEPRVSFCLGRSVDRLDPRERRLFQAFSLYPQPTTVEAAAAAAEVGSAYTPLLERLVRLRLVRQADDPQRYRPILRADRLGYVMLEKDPAFRDAATQRAVDFVLGAVRNGPERLEAEIGNMLWATLQAFEAERWGVVIEMRREMGDFLYNRGRYNEALLLGDRAFDAADRLGELDERAWCALYPLAQVHRAQGNLDEAWRWTGRALALFAQEDSDNAYGQAMACLNLGWVLRDRSDAAQAEVVFRRGVELAAEQVRRYGPEIDTLRLQARLQAELAGLARDDGKWAEAVELFRAARQLYLAGSDEGGSASVLSQLAALALDLGNEAEAERLLDEGLRELKDPRRREVRSARFWVLQALLAERRGDLAGAQALLLDARHVLRDEPAEVPRIVAALARITASASSGQPGAGS